MNKLYYSLWVIMALVFTGCSSKGGEQPPITSIRPPIVSPIITDGQRGGVGGDIYGGGSGGINGNIAMDGSAMGAPTERVIYFDFDRYSIRGDARPVIEAHASFLASHSNVPIRLEGHADERGSREYNLALGEKRANSVRDALTLLGVNPQQLTTLSYGEERPIDPSHNEISWQLNRRVELVY